MAFIVEDGTGLSDATSYVEVAFADDYFQRINFTAWSAYTNEQKQNWLEAGTSYADLRWGEEIKSIPLVTTQALEFPRKALTDRYGRKVTGVPDNWKKAVCQYTMQAAKGTLAEETVNTEANLIKKKTVIGPITTEKEWETPVQTTTYKKFPQAELLVQSYVGSGFGAGNKRVIRS